MQRSLHAALRPKRALIDARTPHFAQATRIRRPGRTHERGMTRTACISVAPVSAKGWPVVHNASSRCYLHYSSTRVSVHGRHYYSGMHKRVGACARRTYGSYAPKLLPAAHETDGEDVEEQEELIYEGPFALSIRRVKIFSISSFALTTIGTPALVYFSDADLSTLHKWAVGGLVISFGFFTTALLNWLFKPYVRQMWYRPHSNPKTVRLETLNVLGMPKQRVVQLLDMDAETMRPMATFKDKASGASFFLHAEVVTQQPSLRPILKHVIAFPSTEEMKRQQAEREEEEREELEQAAEQAEEQPSETGQEASGMGEAKANANEEVLRGVTAPVQNETTESFSQEQSGGAGNVPQQQQQAEDAQLQSRSPQEHTAEPEQVVDEPARLDDVPEDIESEINMLTQAANIVIFSKTTCGFCMRAKATIVGQGFTPVVVEVNTLSNGYEWQNTLEDMTGQRTVPSVWVNGEFVGGNAELTRAIGRGLLDDVSAEETAEKLKAVPNTYDCGDCVCYEPHN